jgi:cell shape-determining protein MreC
MKTTNKNYENFMINVLYLLSIKVLNSKYKLLSILFIYVIITLVLKNHNILSTTVDCMLSHQEALERIAQLEQEKLHLIEDNARLNESHQIMKTALDTERKEMEKILHEISAAAHQEETLRDSINKHLENCLKHKVSLEEQLSTQNMQEK